jgi:AcrR family transcriptional regulator
VLYECRSLRYFGDMSNEARKQIISRRTRPSKSPLSREVIVSTALTILEREGLSKLSFRRIATALDTGPASLYVYLKNLEELYVLILEQALAGVKPAKTPKAPWRKRLKSLLLAYFRALYTRRGLAQIALSTIAGGRNALHFWEQILALLKEGGAEGKNAAWGMDLLILYVTAIAAEQNNWRDHGDGPNRIKETVAGVSPEQFPMVFALKESMFAGNGTSRLEWGLDVLIDGILAQSSAPSPITT